MRSKEMLEGLLLAFHVARHKCFYIKSSRAFTPSAEDLHHVVPAARTFGSSMAPLAMFPFLQRVYALTDCHGPSSASGTRASRAVPACHASSSAVGTFDPRAASLRHASGRKKASRTARRPHAGARLSSVLRETAMVLFVPG